MAARLPLAPRTSLPFPPVCLVVRRGLNQLLQLLLC